MDKTVERASDSPTAIGQGPLTSALRWVAAVATALVGALSVLSAITPDIPGRRHLLLAVEPGSIMTLGHVLATVGGLALVYVGWGIVRGRRRAVNIAIVVLGVLAILHAAKGLDYEEAGIALALAVILYAARRTCTRGSASPRGLIAATIALCALALAYSFDVIVLLADHRVESLGTALGSAASTLSEGAWWLSSGEPSAIILDVLIVVFLGAGALFLHGLLRPAQAATGHSPADHERAAEILARYGSDSLDPFALREEKSFFFSRDGLIAYRTLRGTAIVSGDPIGPKGNAMGIVADFLGFAAEKGWEVVFTAASDRLLEGYQTLGLRTMCIGEEAVVNPAEFSLEGRAIRKVRQSVTRAERQGWTLEVVEGLDPNSVLAGELAAVERAWRAGRQRLYGFAMSLGRLWGSPEDATAAYALARAPGGELRSFIRFARCGNTLSLDVMRRSGDEPNGLNEALIARTLVWAREHGIGEVSLNFAGFAHVIAATDPTRGQRFLRWALERVHGRFQLERLRTFNDKFHPHWRKRFLVYEAHTRLPLVALRVLQAEAYIRPPRSRSHALRWTPRFDVADPSVRLPRPGSTR